MIIAKTILKMRERDAFGSGEFGASRAGGSRTHMGVDYAAHEGDIIFPVKDGKVSKIGYPYSDDLSFRYVQITDLSNNKWRYFYIFPDVQMGEVIDIITPLGMLQTLQERYPGITDHVHLEVIANSGVKVDPASLLS